MNTKLLVTIDTEEDWPRPGSDNIPGVDNIYKIPELQEKVFDEFGVRPVYLLTHSVATDPRSVSVIGEISAGGKCEIGAHLHHWHMPPYTGEDLFKKLPQFKLPAEIEKRRIRCLTRTIEAAFKIRPVTFRAGRWGADGETIKILADLGYMTDLSVTPLVDNSNHQGADFFYANFTPYFPSYENILLRYNGSDPRILEIPVTYGFSNKDFEKIRKVYRMLLRTPGFLRLIGIASRLNIVKTIKLSPEKSDFSEMKTLVDMCIERGQDVLHLTFHSSINSVGSSPYSLTATERDVRIDALYKILDYLVNVKKARSSTAKEIYMDRKSVRTMESA